MYEYTSFSSLKEVWWVSRERKNLSIVCRRFSCSLGGGGVSLLKTLLQSLIQRQTLDGGRKSESVDTLTQREQTPKKKIKTLIWSKVRWARGQLWLDIIYKTNNTSPHFYSLHSSQWERIVSPGWNKIQLNLPTWEAFQGTSVDNLCFPIIPEKHKKIPITFKYKVFHFNITLKWKKCIKNTWWSKLAQIIVRDSNNSTSTSTTGIMSNTVPHYRKKPMSFIPESFIHPSKLETRVSVG